MSLIDDIESMHQHIADAYDVIAAGGGGRLPERRILLI